MHATPSRQRTAPGRSCIGCGAKRPKALLWRLVLEAGGQLLVDATQRQPGRGAYLCGPGCLKAALKRKAFQRAFRGRFASLDVAGLEARLMGSEDAGTTRELSSRQDCK